MIKLYYRGEIVAHVATNGANMAQVQACREIAAEKLNVPVLEIRLMLY